MKSSCSLCRRTAVKRKDEKQWRCYCTFCGRFGVKHHADGSWRCIHCDCGSSADPKKCPKCGTTFTPTRQHLKYPDGSTGADFCPDCLTRLRNWGLEIFSKATAREAVRKFAKGGFRN